MGYSSERAGIKFVTMIEGGGYQGGAQGYLDLVRSAEDGGFDVVTMVEHAGADKLAPFAALSAAAQATSTIHVGTMVLTTPFRHPALVAHEAATIDALSGGRFELGLGLGGAEHDFDLLGMTYRAFSQRVAQFKEAFHIIDQLLRGSSVTVEGEYYQVRGLAGNPQPVRQPRLPIAMGAGGRRSLALAGAYADTIAISPDIDKRGKMLLSSMTQKSLTDKISWIKDGAADRFANIELATEFLAIEFADDAETGARNLLDKVGAGDVFEVVAGEPVEIADVLANPFVLIGTPEEMAQKIRRQAQDLGITRFGIPWQFIDGFRHVITAARQ